jgi:RNA polymerase sigma-70 factor (ECF subfamily)
MSSHAQLPTTGATPCDDPVRQGLANPEVALTLRKLIGAALGCYPAGTTLAQRDSEAEEMFQEVAVQALRSSHGFDPERGSLMNWLGAIVWNVARQRRPARCAATEPATLDETLIDQGSPIPDDVAHRIDARAILEHLPADDARLLEWHAQGWTAQEIAEEMQLTPGNVRVRLSRLKRRVRGMCQTTNREADHD